MFAKENEVQLNFNKVTLNYGITDKYFMKAQGLAKKHKIFSRKL